MKGESGPKGTTGQKGESGARGPTGAQVIDVILHINFTVIHNL